MNVSMYRQILTGIAVIAVLILTTGCTRKHNLTGDNWSIDNPHLTRDTTL